MFNVLGLIKFTIQYKIVTNLKKKFEPFLLKESVTKKTIQFLRVNVGLQLLFQTKY